MSRNTVLSALAVIVLLAATYFLIEQLTGGAPTTETSLEELGPPLVKISIPSRMNSRAQAGQDIYVANCAYCHGVNATGQDGIAPPLVHIVYEPNHHGDESFQRAVAQGVRQHHWPFGDMPPVGGLSRYDVTLVTEYIRTLQRANGIR
ncbi:c-type cytochrome [Oricola sp.]|uniref:c-type cytochrome n=1 Tax=Oricola sp. TaxID=1979950 RepID=UPI003BAC92F7